MLSDRDTQHLKRALFSNKVVLFLGAGFSCGAISDSGSPVPIGKELEKILHLHSTFKCNTRL